MIVAIAIFFLLACVTSLVLTALIREVAPRIGLTDPPDLHRKLHPGSMPLGGGVAIFLAMVSVLGVVMVQENVSLLGVMLAQDNPFHDILWQQHHLHDLVSLLLAGGVIVLVGLIDDRIGLSGRQKLLGQLVAVSLLMFRGLLIQRIGLFGLPLIDLRWFAIPFTLFWLLGAINALNLLDGIDGLATTMGVILAATIGIMAAKIGRPEVAIVAFVFTGSLVGFMRFNFPPASIFLGDAGSMLTGLVVGVLAIQGSLKGPGTVLLAAPLAVWAIPIFDSMAAIIRRKLTGRSIYTTDRAHLHHRLLNLLGSNRKVLAWLTGCCAVTSAAALLSVFFRENPKTADQSDLIALLTCCAVVVIFIISGVFGRAELLLLGSRVRKEVGRLFVLPRGARQGGPTETTIRLQGSRQWERVWEGFTESVDKLRLTEIHLDLDLPAVHEGYHASWERSEKGLRERCWQIEFLLVSDGRPIGRLAVSGARSGQDAHQDIQQLLELIEPLEVQVAELSEAASLSTAADRAQGPADGRLRPVELDSAEPIPAPAKKIETANLDER